MRNTELLIGVIAISGIGAATWYFTRPRNKYTVGSVVKTAGGGFGSINMAGLPVRKPVTGSPTPNSEAANLKIANELAKLAGPAKAAAEKKIKEETGVTVDLSKPRDAVKALVSAGVIAGGSLVCGPPCGAVSALLAPILAEYGADAYDAVKDVAVDAWNYVF